MTTEIGLIALYQLNFTLAMTSSGAPGAVARGPSGSLKVYQ